MGTGLGPTLEFYALVSTELQRCDLGLWNDSDSYKHQQIADVVKSGLTQIDDDSNITVAQQPQQAVYQPSMPQLIYHQSQSHLLQHLHNQQIINENSNNLIVNNNNNNASDNNVINNELNMYIEQSSENSSNYQSSNDQQPSSQQQPNNVESIQSTPLSVNSINAGGPLHYVNAPHGLFPIPLSKTAKTSHLSRLKYKFKFLGKFMAKAVMDSRMVS